MRIDLTQLPALLKELEEIFKSGPSNPVSTDLRQHLLEARISLREYHFYHFRCDSGELRAVYRQYPTRVPSGRLNKKKQKSIVVSQQLIDQACHNMRSKK